MAKLKLINVLLRLKRQGEDQAAARFARAKGGVETLRAQVRRLEESLSEHDRLIRQALAESPSPRALSAAMERYRQQTSVARDAIARQRQALVHARKELADARLQLLEAIARRKSLEQLAGQAQAKAAREQRRLDTKELDESHLARKALTAVSRAEL